MTIIIRKFRKGDGKGRAEIVNEGIRIRNWKYTGRNKLLSKKDIEKAKEDSSKKKGEICFVAIDKEKNKIVGSTEFFFKKNGRTRHRVDLGWGIHPDYQKKGVGTKLLRTALQFAKKKGFKRAEAEMAIKNKGSVKLAKKLGFKIEGTKKKALLTDDGKYIDTYIVGKILK